MQYPRLVSSEHNEPILDTLEITGLSCPGPHGAYAGEQDETRVFLVDVRVRTDIARAARTDSLENALDIAALAAAVREVMAGPPRALLERLALDAVRTLLQRFGTVEQARVRVRKPHPPGLDAIEEAVEVIVSRT